MQKKEPVGRARRRPLLNVSLSDEAHAVLESAMALGGFRSRSRVIDEALLHWHRRRARHARRALAIKALKTKHA